MSMKEEIQELKTEVERCHAKLRVAERFCEILKCRSCSGYYAGGYVCDCGRDNSYSNKEWEEIHPNKK